MCKRHTLFTKSHQWSREGLRQLAWITRRPRKNKQKQTSCHMLSFTVKIVMWLCICFKIVVAVMGWFCQTRSHFVIMLEFLALLVTYSKYCVYCSQYSSVCTIFKIHNTSQLVFDTYLICCAVPTQIEGAKNVEHTQQSSIEETDKQLDM